MISAAEVTIRPVSRQAADHRPAVVAVAHIGRPDGAEQEHLVVHREPEQHGEHQQRYVAGYRDGPLQADRCAPQPHWKTAVSTP